MKLDYQRRNELLQHPELKLPNAENAILPEPKFTKYLFDENSEKGYPKGRAFTDRLGSCGFSAAPSSALSDATSRIRSLR